MLLFKCCWSGFGGHDQRGRGIPRLVFLFLRDRGGMVGVLLSSSSFFPVQWPQGGVGSSACPGMMLGRGRLRGLGGCWDGLWRASLGFFGRSPGAGAALTKPLYSPPIIFLRWCRGRDQIPREGLGGQLLLFSWPGSPRQTLLGDQLMEGPGRSATTGLSPAPPPLEAQTCAGLSAQDWPFFLCLFLLSLPFSPCCHPVSPPPPPPCQGVRWKPEVSPSAAPFEMSDPRGFVLSRDEKVPNAALKWQQVTKIFQKQWTNPFPFLYRELPLLRGPRQTEPNSARSGWLSKSKCKEVQLISVHSLKSQVKGGGEGEVMKFLIKKKKNNKSVYIYICGYNLILVPQWGAV